MNRKIKMTYLAVVCVKIIFTTALLVNYPDSFLSADSSSYIIPASTLWSGMQFANEAGPEVFRTPGYPIFLAPGYVVGVPVIIYAAFLQLILVFICASLVFKITVNISENITAAHASAFLTLLSPEIILSQHLVLSEILFSFLLTLAAYLLVRWHHTARSSLLIAAFLTITIATFVRPTSLYLPYVLGCTIIFWSLLFDAIGKKVLTSILVLLVGGAHMTATDLWKERNFQVSGQREFATVQSVNMNEYIAASIIASGEKKPWREVRSKYSEAYHTLPAEERKKFANDTFLNSVKNYPVESIRIFLSGMFTNMFDAGLGDWVNFFELRRKGSGIIYKYKDMSLTEFVAYLVTKEKLLLLSSIIGFCYMLVTWTSFTYGTFRIEFKLPVIMLLTVIAYVIVVSSGPQSLSRFRVPVMPLILVFASIGLTTFFSRLRKRD